MTEVDIVIPHYGVGPLTDLALTCLRSIRAHSRNYRVILVDNASPEIDLLRPTLNTMPHLLIRNSENVGFIRAVNQGLEASRAPLLVLMNNDTQAVEGWLPKLTRPLVMYESVGLSGPLTTTPNSWQGKWKIPFGAGPIHRLALGRMLAFFCVMIRRTVFEKLGRLDESYGVGFGDDDEYCRRAERAGFRLALAQDLVIPHNHRSTFKQLYTAEQIKAMQDAAMERFKSTQ